MTADLRPPLFRDMQEMLRFEYPIFSDDPRPIETLMQFDDGYYFLPVFYTLCKFTRLNSDWLAGHLVQFLDSKFHSILDTLKRLDPQVIQYATRDMSINTLHFCANNVSMPKLSLSYPLSTTCKFIVENNKRAVLHVTSNDRMIELVRKLQSRYIPVQRFACKKKNPCIWNVSTESWRETRSSSTEITDLINNLWYPIRKILIRLREEENENPNSRRRRSSSPLIDGFDVKTVVDAITSDTKQSSVKELDPYKWFLRLHDGSVLDSLTGHVGGVVPELFVSDLKLPNFEIPRKEMIELCSSSNYNHPLIRLYETLTSREFFSAFVRLSHARPSTSQDFYLPLRFLVKMRKFAKTRLSTSMLRFYMNLCKWTCFDYDSMMLLLNHLSRVYTGTNTEEQIFVVHGTGSNGKTQLLRLMERVLGGYHHGIQSEYSTPPELSLYRMVTSESFTRCGNSFKKLYDLYAKYSTTCRMFVETNCYYHPECDEASKAFKEKAVVIPFRAEFTNREPDRKHVYPSEPEIVEDSLEGCFFMLYYHLKSQFLFGSTTQIMYDDEQHKF